MDLRNWFSILFIFFLINLQAQDVAVKCIDPAFEKEVDSYLSYDIPIITIADAYDKKDNFQFFDARELDEYTISHIKGARHIGYDDFDIKTLSEIDKNTPLIVYCSIGYRSEKIGKKLVKAGFTNVKNLYGSIFEWVNQHYPVYDSSGNETLKIHTYNRKWSKWVAPSELEKVW